MLQISEPWHRCSRCDVFFVFFVGSGQKNRSLDARFAWWHVSFITNLHSVGSSSIVHSLHHDQKVSISWGIIWVCLTVLFLQLFTQYVDILLLVFLVGRKISFFMVACMCLPSKYHSCNNISLGLCVFCYVFRGYAAIKHNYDFSVPLCDILSILIAYFLVWNSRASWDDLKKVLHHGWHTKLLLGYVE